MADCFTVPKSSSDSATCRVRMHLLLPQGQVQTLPPHTLTHLVSLRLMMLRHMRSRQMTRTEARTQIRKLQQVPTCLVTFCTCVIALPRWYMCHCSPRRSDGEGLEGLASACPQSGFTDSVAPLLFIASFWACFSFGVTVAVPINKPLLRVKAWS